jgi:hypothetical protein
MTPVVMLVFNTGALSFLFLTVFCLTMTYPSFQYILVIYLMIIMVRVIELIASAGGKNRDTVINILDITQSVHLAFSLLINIFATSIIGLKAWCVRVDRVF